MYIEIRLLSKRAWLEKLSNFVRIFREILREYACIWSKNLTEMPKKVIILITKWSFKKSLL